MRPFLSRASALACALLLVPMLAVLPASAGKLPAPQFDKITIQGTGSGGDGSGFTAKMDGAASGQTLSGWFATLINGTPTVTSLRAFNSLLVSAGTVIQVGGYNSLGDPGGGLFYWSPSSTAADDGGSVIKPTAVSGAGRWVRVIVGPPTVQHFGARCDGATDDGPAFRAALAVHRTVFVPVAGCSAPYRVDTTVTVPASKSLVGQAPGKSVSQVTQPSVTVVTVAGQAAAPTAGAVTDETGPGSIVTRTNVDTFVTGGGGVTFDRLSIAHFGTSGSAIRSPGGTYLNISNSKVAGYNKDSTDPVIYTAGSSFNIENNIVNNSRARTSWAIEVERTTAGIVIESYIVRNQLDGRWLDTSNATQAQVYSGSGIWVHSSVNGARPEGIHVLENSIVTKGKYQYLANRGLLLRLANNVFDVGRERTVVFDPDGIGIDTVTITGNWFAAENNGGFVDGSGNITTGYGKCLELSNDSNVANGTSSGIANVNVVSNQFHFCSHGLVGMNSVNGLAATGNNFVSMQTWAAQFVSANRVTFNANTMVNIGAGKYIFASDGPGGPYIIADNTFSGGASTTLDLARSDASRFFVTDNHGVSNSNFRDQTTRLAFTTAGVSIGAGFQSVMLIPLSTISSATITLADGGYTGQPLEINQSTFGTTALSFSPAVTNWTNGSSLPAYGRISMRWDATAGAWVRYQ